MACYVHVLPTSKLGLVTGHGHVTGGELADACVDLVHEAAWETGFDEVWDLSDSSEIDVSPDEFDDLVSCTRAYADRVGHNRVAFVTTRDAVTPLLRLFERLTEDLDRTYQTVRTRAEAAAWLGLPPEALTADGD